MCFGLVDVGRSCSNLAREKVEFEVVGYNRLGGPWRKCGSGECN